MKNSISRKIFSLSWIVLFAMVLLGSCKKDETPGTKPILVEDGLYIKGAATALADLDVKGMMATGINEVDQTARPTMYVIYMALEADKDFNIVEVAGSNQTVYGPDQMETLNVGGRNDQVNVDFQLGTYGQSGAFTVPTSGLYQIILDKGLGKIAIVPVQYWAIIGGATDKGWSDTQMDLKGSFNKDSMTFEATNIVLRQGDFKFRYSGGWKLGIADTTASSTVKVNTNFGGTVDALVPGGSNIPFLKDNEGVYTVRMTWTLNGGNKATLTKTGNVEPLPEYPSALYMIGDGVGTWDWAVTDLPMIPVNSHANAFWKVVWMKGTGGFKFAPSKQWGQDFGVGDGAVAGTNDYLKGSNNAPVPADSGYYMVYVDLAKDSISVTPANIYLIGDAIGSWNTANPDGQFTVDNTNKVITITKTMSATDGIRMYAWHKWMTDWWQSEFIVLDGKIAFRGTGGDQTRVPVTAAEHTVTLNFITGDGSIN